MRTNKLVFTLFTLIAVAAFIASCAPKAAPVATGGDLESMAKAEGTLTTIALPHDWANYGEILETFKTVQEKYDDKYEELMEKLKAALEAIARCEETVYEEKDWYQRYGFVYYEFMAARYQRTD